MPRGDRTGPIGSGPMTGRGMGYCAGSTGPGFMSSMPGFGLGRGGGFGRGFGRGFGPGRGRGWRHPYAQETPYSMFQPITGDQEVGVLEEQAKILEGELNQLKTRLTEIKSRKKEK